MNESERIRETAAKRGLEKGVPYAGSLLPAEAWTLLEAGARLIDVRTRAELDWVGRIPGAQAIEWNSYPDGARNADFVLELEAISRRDETVMFICRSGARSHNAAAAAAKAGFASSYNVLEGFEGDRDGEQHRNTIGGWRKAGLPWEQS